MKKLFALLLAMVMVFSLATVAFADNKAIPTNGSITIKNVAIKNNGTSESNYTTVAGYSVYQILKLYSYTPGTPATETAEAIPGKYSYIINPGWEDFFEDNADPAIADAMDYVTLVDGKYVTAKANFTDETAPAFAALAIEYAKTRNLVPVQTEKDAKMTDIKDGSSATLTFNDLELGYYLIDSTMGTLCGLTTTNPNASVTAKNHPPKIEKQVQEDSKVEANSQQTYGNENTADVGQEVRFSTTITVTAGAENYCMHDTMGNGFTFIGIESINHIIPGRAISDDITDIEEYWTLKETPGDGCAFEIVFTPAFHDVIKDNDKIVIVYTATLNKNAEIFPAVNTNEAWLTFGDGSESAHSKTDTKAFAFDLVKTDDENKKISGAKFLLCSAADRNPAATDGPTTTPPDKTVIPVVKVGNGYRRAVDGETGVEIEVTNGQVRIEGFDNGTYYLEETEAPEGYNKLITRHPFTINDNNLDASYNQADSSLTTGTGVQVKNKTGNMLPETGSFGTTMFVTFGMFVVLGTGILLVTKKRMSMIED